MTAVFALASCSFSSEITSEATITADGKADSLELLNGFLEEMLKQTNIKITAESEGKVQVIEYIEGDKGYVDSQAEGGKMYTCKQGDEFITAIDSGDSQYYTAGEETYNSSRFLFMNGIKALNEVPEEGSTFKCETKTVEKTADGKTESTADLTFDLDYSEETLKMTASAKNGLVQSITFNITDKTSGKMDVSTFTFEYGSVSVTIPDLTNWFKF